MASEYPWVPPFGAIAESFGAKGFRLQTYDRVDDVLTAALVYNGPSVVDAHIDLEEDVYPMVASGCDNAQFALNSDQL